MRSNEPYEEGTNWDECTERLQGYLKLHKERITTNRMKVSIPIAAIGQKIYSRLQDLSSPAQLNKRTNDQLDQLLGKSYSPKQLVIAESFSNLGNGIKGQMNLQLRA